MTPFLASVTPRGVERARRVREAATAEEMKTLIQQMMDDAAIEFAHGAIFTAADEYIFSLALAGRPGLPARASAASYDGAAHLAISAQALGEALVAFEKAEDAQPSPVRRKTIAQLRQALFPTTANEQTTKKRRSRRPRRER